jgi:hypothetical protein
MPVNQGPLMLAHGGPWLADHGSVEKMRMKPPGDRQDIVP